MMAASWSLFKEEELSLFKKEELSFLNRVGAGVIRVYIYIMLFYIHIHFLQEA